MRHARQTEAEAAMRRTPAARMVAVAAALLVAALAAPAQAKGPPEIVEFTFEFDDVNPCTGEVHTIVVDTIDRVHAFDNDANRVHVNALGFFHVTTSDGFSGTVMGPAAFNATLDEEDVTGVFTEVFTGVLHNPDTGQRFRFHQLLHVTVVDGVVIVDDFTVVSQCLGSNSG
jgi:hypothetical protein